MDSKNYDYAIVGAGAAGLQLALKMIKDPFFSEKQILILEKDKKNTNDRTWCFWEKGESEWDRLATKTWKKGLFINNEKVVLNLSPYRYKMIRSADFYNHAKAILKQKVYGESRPFHLKEYRRILLIIAKLGEILKEKEDC